MQRRMFVLSLVSIMAPLFRVGAAPISIEQLPDRFRNPDAAKQLASFLSAKARSSLGTLPPDGDLEAYHQRDFEQGRVLVVDGWIISRSEAATCVRLSKPKGA